MKKISLSLLPLLCAFSLAAMASPNPPDQLRRSCKELLQPINESAGNGQPIKMRLDNKEFSKSFGASVDSGFKSYWNDRQKASALRSFFKSWHRWRLDRLRRKTLSQQPSHQMQAAKDATELVKPETWLPENAEAKTELLEKLNKTFERYQAISDRIQLLYMKAYVHYASYRLLKEAYDYHLPTEDMPLSIEKFPVVEVDQNGKGELDFKGAESYQSRYAIKSDLEKHKKKWRSLVGYVFKRGEVGVLEAEQAQLRADLKTYRWAFNDAKLENRFVDGLEEHWQEMNSLLNNSELTASSVASLALARKMRLVEKSRYKEIKKGTDTVYEDWVEQLLAASEGVVDRDTIERGLEEIGFEKVKTALKEKYNNFKETVKKQAKAVMSRMVSITIYTTMAVSAASQWDRLVDYAENATDGIVDKGVYAINRVTDYSLAIDRIAQSENFELEKSIFIDTYFPDLRDALLADEKNRDALNSKKAQELREVLLEIEWRRFEYQSLEKQKFLSEKEKQAQKEAYDEMLQNLLSEVNYLNIRMIFLAIEDKRATAQAHTFIDYLQSVSDEDIDSAKSKKLRSWYKFGILKHSAPPRMEDLNLNMLLSHMLSVRKSYDELMASHPEMTTTQALSALLQDEDYKPFTFGEGPLVR